MNDSREFRPSPKPAAPHSPAGREIDVLKAIRDTRFGTIEIIIHQSQIVQITRSEKVRFDPN